MAWASGRHGPQHAGLPVPQVPEVQRGGRREFRLELHLQL